eukprot:756044-Hanusia_phi.AAC.4
MLSAYTALSVFVASSQSFQAFSCAANALLTCDGGAIRQAFTVKLLVFTFSRAACKSEDIVFACAINLCERIGIQR